MPLGASQGRSDGLPAPQWTQVPDDLCKTPRLTISDRWWLSVLCALSLIDLWRHRKGDKSTFCDTIRRVFGTDTEIGRTRFRTAAQLFIKHILK